MAILFEQDLLVGSLRLVLDCQLPRIRADYWLAWLNLAEFYAMQGLEVGAIICLSEKFDYCYLAVPSQVVSATSVEWLQGETVDLISGLPIHDPLRLGTIHSHHAMDCSFSAVDDAGDLMSQAIEIHLLSRSFPNWQHDQSICAYGRRYILDLGLIPESEDLPKTYNWQNLPIVTGWQIELYEFFLESLIIGGGYYDWF